MSLNPLPIPKSFGSQNSSRPARIGSRVLLSTNWMELGKMSKRPRPHCCVCRLFYPNLWFKKLASFSSRGNCVWKTELNSFSQPISIALQFRLNFAKFLVFTFSLSAREQRSYQGPMLWRMASIGRWEGWLQPDGCRLSKGNGNLSKRVRKRPLDGPPKRHLAYPWGLKFRSIADTTRFPAGG